jgi:hypothetical protein
VATLKVVFTSSIIIKTFSLRNDIRLTTETFNQNVMLKTTTILLRVAGLHLPDRGDRGRGVQRRQAGHHCGEPQGEAGRARQDLGRSRQGSSREGAHLRPDQKER